MILRKLFKFFTNQNKSVVLSYKALRTLIGILGMALPLINILGGLVFASLGPQQSISIYYYSNMRDFFVGLMFTVSFFLMTYKGKAFIDFLLTFLAGLGGLLLAVLPCNNPIYKDQHMGIFGLFPAQSDPFHVAGAATFFLCLALTSIFIFTLQDPARVTKQKKVRNWIYVICGLIMIISLAAIGVIYKVLDHQLIADLKLVLILESVMLLAFGTSWLTKGGTICPDPKGKKKPKAA